MTRQALTLAALAVAFPAVARAEDSYRHGRVRHVEPGVSLQRAAEAGAEEAIRNLPFLPGDRVWTDDRGRVEFQFADGSVARLDSRSKLDYVAHEDSRRDERVILRLWSGALFLHVRDARRSPEFAVETPGGVVEASERGVYRVDAEAGEAQVSVYEGEAVLQADRRVRLEAGERVVARGGEVYGEPEAFDRGEADEFARWDADQQARVARARQAPEYLPEEVSPYADELDGHGAWYYEAEVGHVWRPYVDPGWRPYFNGRWIWTAYGWTWVPHETWGWAAFHYGRWGHSPALGWYWIPGNHWGPAWVTWAVGGDYVGWCPRGWRDRPIVIHERGRNRGRAVPRDSVAANPWVYARRSDLGARDLAHRITTNAAAPRDLVVVEASRGQVTRDFRVVDAATRRPVPRNVRTNPGPGDTTPELRSDPATTIPFPVARRRYESERDRQAEREGERGMRAPLPRQDRGQAAAGAGAAPAPAAPPEASRPIPWTARPRPAPSQAEQRERPPQAEQRERPPQAEQRERHDRQAPDANREVMRPLFRPLGRPRPDGAERHPGGARDQGGVRNEGGRRPEGGVRGWGESRPERAAPRSEPRPVGPPPAAAAPREPRPAGGGERAVPRQKEKQN